MDCIMPSSCSSYPRAVIRPISGLTCCERGIRCIFSSFSASYSRPTMFVSVPPFIFSCTPVRLFMLMLLPFIFLFPSYLKLAYADTFFGPTITKCSTAYPEWAVLGPVKSEVYLPLSKNSTSCPGRTSVSRRQKKKSPDPAIADNVKSSEATRTPLLSS
ncbi:unnamed protein product [Cyclocybe aegerita]|uniref:Uncharacterized protein n=1 Tax=Cyclocybe aegerita TaxID=1973307 RepID=A0A8S0WSF0_CYCAE|nr:unnamed protein product [Cyclocybe aegerita]